MKSLVILLVLLSALIGPTLPASAQSPVIPYLQNPTAGGLPYPVDSGHPLPVTGTFTASLGGFTPSASGARATPLSVTTSDGNATLPTGAVVAVTNVGTTNPMYCNVNGIAATTSDQYIAPSGGWFAFTIPASVTVLHCISTGGNTTANMVGGSGLATGTGGGSGSGGGGGGAVYGPTAVGTAAANPPVLEGGTSDGTATGTVGVWKIVSGIGYLNLAQVNGVTVLAGAGATGTGSQRITVAQDTSTVAGSASIPAGTNKIGTIDPATIATWGLATLGGATAPTNALAIAAEYLTSAPTYTTGQTGALQMTAAGSLHTTVDNTNSNLEWNADGVAATQLGAPVSAGLFAYNGSTWDRLTDDGNKYLQVNVKTATVSAQADPCFASSKTNLPISQNGTSSAQLIALSGSTSIYVCSLSLIAAGATTVAITTGTGTACVTSNAAVIGTTTANIANSMSLAANGGLTLGSGVGTIAKGAASSELCMVLGTSVYVSGNLTYVQQ